APPRRRPIRAHLLRWRPRPGAAASPRPQGARTGTGSTPRARLARAPPRSRTLLVRRRDGDRSDGGDAPEDGAAELRVLEAGAAEVLGGLHPVHALGQDHTAGALLVDLG